MPPPAPPARAARWRGVRSWSYAVCAALGTIAIVAVVVFVTEIQQLSVLSDRTESFSDITRRIDLGNRIDSLNDAFLAIALITAVVFITWMWRAAKNNQALGRQRPRFGPGWAIGGWFIPIANFVIPVLIMQDLWRGSDQSIARDDMRWKIADRSALVGWWWGLLLASRALYGVGNSVGDNGGLANVRSGIGVQTVGTAVTIVAAVLAILVVRRLTERQEECLRAQNEQWGQQPAPAPAPLG